MNVCVVGLWHLGSVTAACLASAGHTVTGLEENPQVVGQLASGKPPLLEPGLEDLFRRGIGAGTLRFVTNDQAVAEAEVVWVTYDTPVDADDKADVRYVTERVGRLFPYLRDGALVLISSQLPVGTTASLERQFARQQPGRRVSFAYSPENLRLGKAIEVFAKPDRIVVGTRSAADRPAVERLLAPFGARIEWMSIESAEMTKHALNAFLATSVVFINEIAAVCEQVGADAGEVARGLKSEARIGPRAYLSPGAAFAGGTLARDVVFLSRLGQEHRVDTQLIGAVKSSNDAHRRWAQRRLADVLGSLRGRRIAVWGLTYKPGTSTLRRSSSMELCQWLHEQGATVFAHDPGVASLPGDIRGAPTLVTNPLAAVERADALIVATPWPQFRELDRAEVASRMAARIVLDENRFLDSTFGGQSEFRYLSVGRPA